MDRPSRLPGNLLLLFSIAVLIAAAALYLANDGGRSPAASLHLTQASWQETVAAGHTPPPAELDSAALPPDWRPVSLPFSPSIALLRQAASGAIATPPQAVRISWLKVAVDKLPAAAASDVRLLALYGIRVKTDGTIAVYINGKLAHQAQVDGPAWNSTRTPLWFTLDQPPGSPPVREILLRLEHSVASQTALSSLRLGPAEVLRRAYHVRLWLQQQLPAMLSAAFMAVGVFAVFVWLRRPQDIAYLLFFNLAATAFLRGLHFYVDLPVANDWFAWLTVNSLFWLVLAVHFFLRQLHRQPLAWLTRALVAVTLLIGVLTLPLLAVLPNMPTVTPLLYPIAPVMSVMTCIAGWRHSPEGRLVVYGLFACTLMGMSDWLLQNNVISAEGWYLGAYAPAVCFITFGILMYRRYVTAIAEVERVNAGLAERLEAREAELEASHQRLRDSELRQTISDERQRLMQDMHDGLGSSLISAIRLVERGDIGDVRVSQILKDCLDDLKLTIDSMEPVEADLLLLLATLRFRLEPRLEGTGVKLLWEVRELPALPWLNPSSALHILRIVQESVANILRHTRATEISVATSAGAGGVAVHIADNGGCFDIARALGHGGGRGLQNQRRRAASVEGHVSWQSSGAGTLFTLWLPLQRNA